MKDLKKNSKKDFIWNTLGSLLNSFISLFFMIVVTRLNGLQEAGIFTFSFSSACIINMLALYSGRTYQVTDDNKIVSHATYIVSRIITCSVGIIVTVLFALFNGYSFNKMLIFITLCSVKCLEALIDAYYGITQKKGYLQYVGKSMFARSMISFLCFSIVDFVTKNLILSCIVYLLITILFLFFVDQKIANQVESIKMYFSSKELKSLFTKASYVCMFSLIVTIGINIPKYAIDAFSTEEVQAIYGIVSMPATFVMLLGQFILQPSLVKMGTYYHDNKKKEFDSIVFKLSAAILGIMIVVLPCAYFLGIPVLNILYGVEFSEYKWALQIILLGAAFYTISQILLNALVTLRCTKEQLYLQLFSLFSNILVSYTLVKYFGLWGSIWSYFFVLSIQFILYVILYRWILKKKFK